jgi:mannose-6-phosphate isomerase-like protein (cupin superfamily)
MPKEGKLFSVDSAKVEFKDILTPCNSNLSFLSLTFCTVKPAGVSSAVSYKDEESLISCLEGEGTIEIDDSIYTLKRYDILYIPRNTKFIIKNEKDIDFKLYIARAPSNLDAPVVYKSFEEVIKDSSRHRPLKRKDVYLMLGEEEKASLLTGGYTFFQTYSRSWPIHKHEDQEEIYIFLKGRGAMEVFDSEEEKTFVKSVGPGDIVTIPIGNYHPAFSHEEPLEFLWIIAGARYWVGDKDKNFMEGAKR